MNNDGKFIAEWRVALDKSTACVKETMEGRPQTQTRLSISRTLAIRSAWNGMNFSAKHSAICWWRVCNYILNLPVHGPFLPSPGWFEPNKSTQSQGAGTVIQSGMLGSPPFPRFSRAMSA